MIDKNKKYRTRDGREVRIYATDGGNHADYVHGAIKEKGGGWAPYQWYSHGGYLSGTGDPRDLIEVKPRIKREVWVNVYPDPRDDIMHTCRDFADHSANKKRIACVMLTIDCEEGEGL